MGDTAVLHALERIEKLLMEIRDRLPSPPPVSTPMTINIPTPAPWPNYPYPYTIVQGGD
jgi:hypothetical protein